MKTLETDFRSFLELLDKIFEKVFLSKSMNEMFERGLIEGNAFKKLVENIFLNRLG